ncbi:MAG: hypothetical protein NTX82_01795 [Candidatus Parcubacteria bacterium]|nr:hypothetical protein [Candidatus Parcubacteria bacterium]
MDQQSQYVPMPEAGQVQPTLPPKKALKKLGLILIIAPFAGLIAILLLYAIITFILQAIIAGSTPDVVNGVAELTAQPSLGLAVAKIVNVVLGVLGIICVLGIFTAFPAGIILLIIEAARKNKA